LIVRLSIFATDVDAFLARLGDLNAGAPRSYSAGTLIGVARLAYPLLMV
jgi:hypothetical protein